MRHLSHLALFLIGILQSLLLPAPPVVAQTTPSTPTTPIASVVECLRPGSERGMASHDSPRYAAACSASRLGAGGYTAPRGDYDAPPTAPSLLTFGDGKVLERDGPGEPGQITQATLEQTGAIWGIAYSSGSNPAAPSHARQPRIFAAAYAKRQTRFGPLGPGGIYSSTLGGYTTPYLQVSGVLPGPAIPNGPGDGSKPSFPNQQPYTPELGGLHLAGDDGGINPWIGKVGLGDLALDPQERYLYTINLWSKQILQADTWASDPQATLRPLPILPVLTDPRSCNQYGRGGPSELRPFALLVTPQFLFVGAVCSAEQSQDRRELAIGVWRFNLQTWQWEASPSLATTLMTYDSQRPLHTIWRPWRIDQCGYSYPNGEPCGSGFHVYTQPLLTSLALDEQGNLLIGLHDRFSDQAENPAAQNRNPALPQGDILHATPLDPANPIAWNTPVGEYFDDSASFTNGYDPENSLGSLSYTPRPHQAHGQVLSTWLDPYMPNSVGAAWFPANGGRPGAYEQTYSMISNPRFGFGKASSFGDVELLCAWASLGDRVWNDLNANGLQDANEPGLDGVQIQLFAANDSQLSTPLATITTGDINGDGVGGEYKFYVNPFQTYQIWVAPTQAALNNRFMITRENITTRGEGFDSDANPITGIALQPALLRHQIERQLDVGVAPLSAATAALGDRVWVDLNGDGVQNETAEYGQNNIPVILEACQDTLRSPACRTWSQFQQTTTATIASASGETAQPGTYLFNRLPPNYYRVLFVPPAGSIATQMNVQHDQLDSDASAATNWASPSVALNYALNRSVDLGLLPPQPQLYVRITGPSLLQIGTSATYTLQYGNTSSIPQPAILSYTPPTEMEIEQIQRNPTSRGTTLRWNLGTLPANSSGSITLVLNPSSRRIMIHQASIATTTQPNTPIQQATLNTTVIGPHLTIQLNGPSVVAPQTTAIYTATIRNQAIGFDETFLDTARQLELTIPLPAGMTLVNETPNAQLRRSLAELRPNQQWQIPFLVRIDARQAASSQLIIPAQVRHTLVNGRVLIAETSHTTTIIYPDLAVVIVGPGQAAEGANLRYRIRYQNLASVAAEQTLLTLQLPTGVALRSTTGQPEISSNTANTQIRWNLATLPAQATGQQEIEIRSLPGFTNAIELRATIASSTPEQILNNNTALFTTWIVAAPPPPIQQGPLNLAIHSELDPLSTNNQPSDAIYRSTGDTIQWPLGEVLDLTPRIALSVPSYADPIPALYDIRVQVNQWEPQAITIGSTTRRPQAADDQGVAGCRARHSGDQSSQTTCSYRYIGGSNLYDQSEPTEADMANQLHLFFGASTPLAMRPDVYVYHLSEAQPIRLTLAIHYTTEVLNRETGVVISSERRTRVAEYTINLIAPRAVR
ncbi:MAG: hypothetical protein OHK0050_36980 [Roseiflexaceae bacterium]